MAETQLRCGKLRRVSNESGREFTLENKKEKKTREWKIEPRRGGKGGLESGKGGQEGRGGGGRGGNRDGEGEKREVRGEQSGGERGGG